MPDFAGGRFEDSDLNPEVLGLLGNDYLPAGFVQ
jgi:hypothetical protein